MIQQQSIRAVKWQRPERTVEDLNRICGESFKKLKIPAHWKFKHYERIRLNEDPTSEIQCIAAIFLDTQTAGFELKNYRVNFHTFSERLSICEVTFKDYGRPAFNSILNNKTPEQVNEYFETIKN